LGVNIVIYMSAFDRILTIEGRFKYRITRPGTVQLFRCGFAFTTKSRVLAA